MTFCKCDLVAKTKVFCNHSLAIIIYDENDPNFTDP